MVSMNALRYASPANTMRSQSSGEADQEPSGSIKAQPSSGTIAWAASPKRTKNSRPAATFIKTSLSSGLTTKEKRMPMEAGNREPHVDWTAQSKYATRQHI